MIKIKKILSITLGLSILPAASALAADTAATINSGDTAWMIVLHSPGHDDDTGRPGSFLRRYVGATRTY